MGLWFALMVYTITRRDKVFFNRSCKLDVLLTKLIINEFKPWDQHITLQMNTNGSKFYDPDVVYQILL